MQLPGVPTLVEQIGKFVPSDASKSIAPTTTYAAPNSESTTLYTLTVAQDTPSNVYEADYNYYENGVNENNAPCATVTDFGSVNVYVIASPTPTASSSPVPIALPSASPTPTASPTLKPVEVDFTQLIQYDNSGDTTAAFNDSSQGDTQAQLRMRNVVTPVDYTVCNLNTTTYPQQGELNYSSYATCSDSEDTIASIQVVIRSFDYNDLSRMHPLTVSSPNVYGCQAVSSCTTTQQAYPIPTSTGLVYGVERL